MLCKVCEVSVGRAVWSAAWRCSQSPRLFRPVIGTQRQRFRQPQAPLALKPSSAAIAFTREDTRNIFIASLMRRRVSCLLVQIQCATPQALAVLSTACAQCPPFHTPGGHAVLMLRLESCRQPVALQRQQVAAQHTSSAPIAPRRELHLHRLCRAARCAGTQRFHCDRELCAVSVLLAPKNVPPRPFKPSVCRGDLVHSLLRFATPLLPPATASRGLSSPPSQTWL